MTELSRFVLELLAKPAKFSSLDSLLHHNPHIQRTLRSFTKEQPLIKDHDEVRSQRYSIPRPGYPHVPKFLYYNFLRELYPPPGSHINHNKLHFAYASLPKPQPLHVQPHHLECLIDEFCKPQGQHGIKAASNKIVPLMNSLKKTGFPISAKEVNSLLHLKNYNEGSVVNIKREWMVISQTLKDVSTANIFLKQAVRFDNYVFVKEIMDWMKAENVAMDRASYDCMLRYIGSNVELENSVELLRSMLKSGVTIDIAILNTVIETLVKRGDLVGAETIVKRLLEFGAQSRPLRNSIERRNHLQLMLYIDSLKLQESKSLLFIPAPTFDTFKPLLNHYISLESFDPAKVSYILRLMIKAKVNVTTKQLKLALQTFKDHDAPITEQLKLIRLLLSTNSLKVDHQLYGELISACQKQERFQSELVNDIDENWGPETRMPYWRQQRDGSDMKKLTLNTIDRLIVAL